MRHESIEIKLRLMEALLIIAGILVATKQISENSSNVLIVVVFFATSILYYAIISLDIVKSAGILFNFIILFLGGTFSALLGIAIGVTTPGSLEIRSLSALSYYVIFTIIIFLALNEKEQTRKWLLAIKKKFLSKRTT